jgi:hypothetical protein
MLWNESMSNDTNGLEVKALFMLSLELKPLFSSLNHWDVIGWFPEEILAACRNQGGVTHKEINRMRQWCRRWQKIGTEARKFYAKSVHKDNGVSWALQQVLNGKSNQIKPSLKGYVQGQFRKTTGSSCPCEMFPDFREII